MTSADQTPLPRRSIAIVGAGKIGSTFAFQLARAGHDVTVVARPGSQRLAQLRQDGAIVTNTGERADVTVAEILDEAKVYDLVVVTTLAHQVDAVIPTLACSKARSIHFMFNIFDPERLRSAIGERATFGMPMVVASLGADGRLKPTISSKRRTLHGDERLAQLFEASGIPSVFEQDMTNWLKCHVAVCIGMEAISIAGNRRGGGASWSEAMTVARGLRAVFAVIAAQGRPIYPRSKAMMARSPGVIVAAMLWSASRVPPIRNALANGLEECRSLIDDVLEAGRQQSDSVLPSDLTNLLAMKPAPN
jgi:2-dehydropantoate 2-reductase